MKKHISILLFAMTLAISACSDLEDRTTTGSSSLFVPHLFTAEELFPSGDVEPFVILPRNGWEVRYGEVIVFKALLLDDETGTYRDVTFDSNCKFVCSYRGGISVNGSDPSLQKGQEITIRASFAGRYGAESIGHYVEDPEWERPSGE